jgi:hypothetical protein
MLGKIQERVRAAIISPEQHAAELQAKYSTPIWRLDADATACHHCSAPLDDFALPKALRDSDEAGRRHHCRWCGEVFCGACSAKRATVRNCEQARVCAPCAEEIGRPGAMRIDPFVSIAASAAPHTKELPAALATILTEPVLLSRLTCCAFCLLVADKLGGVLMWSLAAVALTSYAKSGDTAETDQYLQAHSIPGLAKVLPLILVVGDSLLLLGAVSAEMALFASGRALGALAAQGAVLCLAYSALVVGRRVLMSAIAHAQRSGGSSTELV